MDIQPSQMKHDWNVRAQRDSMTASVNTFGPGEWDEEHWRATGRRTVQNALSLLPKFYPGAPVPEWRVYEIGCGAGRLTLCLADLFQHVTAMDVSPGMLQGLRERVTSDSLESIVTVLEGDGESLPITEDEAGKMDLVFSCIAFQHIPFVEVQLRYLQQIGRLLKRGGVYLVQLYDDHAAYARIRLNWEHNGNPDDGTSMYTHMRTPLNHGDVAAALKRGGLSLNSLTGEGTKLWWIGGQKK